MAISAVSYSAAAVAFLILTVLLFISWRGRLKGGVLVIASFLTMLWAAVSVLPGDGDYPITSYSLVMEQVRNFAWALFLIQALRGVLTTLSPHARIVYRAVFAANFLLPLVVVLFVVIAMMTQGTVAVFIGYDLRVLGQLLIAILGLVLVEQLFRNASFERRWALKFMCLGLGAMYAYDFYFYADAVLFKQLDMDVWAGRGFLLAVVTPLIAVSAARNPDWSIDIFVSRNVVFHTTALGAVGVYLLLIAAGGYYISEFEGEWVGVVRVLFFSIGLIAFVVLFFSGQIRARLRVFVNKHFFNYKYDYREEWLRFINTLSDNQPEQGFYPRAILALANIVDSPGGMVWTQSAEHAYELRQTLNMGPEMSMREVDDSQLCQLLKQAQWVLDLNDVSGVPESFSPLTLPAWLQKTEQAWLVVPLMLEDRLYGFVVLLQPRAPRGFNWEDIDLLKTAGRQVAIHLAQIEAAQALTEARQFEAFNRLSSYVVHDIKNIVAQLSLVASNAEKHRDKPEFIDDAFKTVSNSVGRMNRLLAQLRDGGKKKDQSVEIDIYDVVAAAVADKQQGKPAPKLETDHQSAHIEADEDRFVSIVGHLIQNAQDATADDGEIIVNVERRSGQTLIEVSDTGCGMDEEFIKERLFRPFDTTKGLTGMGIGVFETREFVRELGGELRVQSRAGEGTKFSILI